MTDLAPEPIVQSGRQRRVLFTLVGVVVVAILAVLIAQMLRGCWVDVGNEMGHQPSVGFVEPPRSSAPEAAVPLQGLDVMAGGPEPVNPVGVSAASVADGKALYGTFCLLCHGEPGGQTGKVGQLFAPPPPHLDQVAGSLSDGRIFVTVTQGFGRMPALGQRMSQLDRWDIVNYLRSTRPQATPASSDPLERGAVIFEGRCASCHGPTAGGALGPPLYPSILLREMTPTEVAAFIREGRMGRGMPPFGNVLDDASLADVSALLKDLQVNGPGFIQGYVRRQAQPPSTTPSTAPPTTTATMAPTVTTTSVPGGSPSTTVGVDPALISKGQSVFSADCQPCHGPDGSGGLGPKLKPNDFVSSSDDAAVRATVENGRPGTPMPAWKGKLSPDDITAVVALLRSWQQATGGGTTTSGAAPGGGTTAPGATGTTAAGATTTVPGAAAPPTTDAQGYATIPFLHRPHMEKGGMACLFCHSQARRGPSADLPPLQLCAGCHRWLTFQSGKTKEVVAAYDAGARVFWPRVYRVPDFVFFAHQPHVVVAKLDCAKCHGNVAGMGLARKAKTLNMGFCVGCHKTQVQATRLIDCQICHK